MKSWRRQALFQGRHCFCPTPTLGGGGSSQGGRHPLTALSTVPTQYQTTLIPHLQSTFMMSCQNKKTEKFSTTMAHTPAF